LEELGAFSRREWRLCIIRLWDFAIGGRPGKQEQQKMETTNHGDHELRIIGDTSLAMG
jgi:hypothetical protein